MTALTSRGRQKSDRRSQLLTAAEHLIAERGFLAVRLEEAGVGTARAWLAMQSAHDLAAERASGSHDVRPLNNVA